MTDQEICGACDGSRRMPRDPDIGTDQECFVCDGSGVIAAHEQAAPAVPRGIPAQEVIDAIEAWKSAWLKVPPFADRVNKATREAITISHNSLFLLLQSAQQAQRMPAGCTTPTGCGRHGCHGACIAATPAAPSQERIEMTLRDYADSLIKAGHDFWKACRRDAGGGAVRWLSCDDGTLIVFTRGEYRDAIMGAVGGYRATEVVFEDQANDEQGGVVACAATSQPLTDEVFRPIVKAAFDAGWATCRASELVGDNAKEFAWDMYGDELTERLISAIPSQEPVTLTDEMVTAGGRALCDTAADSCNVDREDNWNMYGEVYKSDAKACIIAALREKQAKVTP